MSSHRNIGAHEVWQEADLIGVRYRGTVSVHEILAIVDYIDAAAARVGDVYLLIDSNEIVLPSSEVRRIMAERGYTHVRAMARYQRNAVKNSGMTFLIQNAARLIGGTTTRAHVVETEPEARAWLEEQRRQLAASSDDG